MKNKPNADKMSFAKSGRNGKDLLQKKKKPHLQLDRKLRSKVKKASNDQFTNVVATKIQPKPNATKGFKSGPVDRRQDKKKKSLSTPEKNQDKKEDNDDEKEKEDNQAEDPRDDQESDHPKIDDGSEHDSGDDSERDSDDDTDEKDEKQSKNSNKRKPNDFSDIKEILAEEFGSQMEKQIKFIEQEEQQDADDHDHEQQAEAEVAGKQKSTRGNDSKHQFDEWIDYIHTRCPTLEKELIVELLKYDDNVIFVGNVPISMHVKSIKKLFQQFGNVQTVRIRGAPGGKGFDKKIACIK